jgi:L-aminopeptidase/D-esterase-like protein
MPDFTPLGVAVGHATDEPGATGCTVIRAVDGHLRGGVAVFGRATGSRELHAVSPDHIADRVDAVLLTGGSAYGLDAAAGVMRWMEERGRGYPVSGGVVPIVPAAVIFDLAPLGRFEARPTAEMAYQACDRALPSAIGEGSVGAGTGATVGKIDGAAHAMKSGVGCSMNAAGGLFVGAVAVVNALGDVRDADGRIIAGARAADGSFLDAARRLSAGPPAASGDAALRPGGLASRLQNTTIAAVVTNAALSRQEVAQLARAAGAALFRRITPTGTSFDGDIVFALATPEGMAAPPLQVETLAVETLERAIESAVRCARGRDGIPGLADGA